jgi:OmpA-OmpF porin, OOP family
MIKNFMRILMIIFVLISTNAFAQSETDVSGSKDYSLVSRFKGSIIQWYEHKNFDRYYLLELKDHQLSPKEIAGDITRIQYSAGKEHSIFEISTSYKTALQNAGFNITLSLNEQNSPSNLNENLYFSEFDGLNKLPRGSHKPDHDGKWSYMEATGQKGNKDIFIVIYITKRDWPLITFDAVEVKKIESGLVTAQDITKEISSTGHIVLDGVYFDTGKSTIKPESNRALKNIAEYLNAHPNKRFFIVGHTDNVGEFNYNINLSTTRSKAVVNALIENFKVNEDQLIPYGIGPTSPLASNTTEDGRAKNRRVEIVEQ